MGLRSSCMIIAKFLHCHGEKENVSLVDQVIAAIIEGANFQFLLLLFKTAGCMLMEYLCCIYVCIFMY